MFIFTEYFDSMLPTEKNTVNTKGEDLIILLTGSDPVSVLIHLNEVGILNDILPELVVLKSETKGHKDNFMHSLGVLNNSIQLELGIIYRLSALLHDIGKAITKRYDKEKGWTFHHHEEVGSKLLPKIWERLNLPENLYDPVYTITKYHGMVKILSEEGVTDSAIRRFLGEVGDNWKILLIFAKTDMTTKYQDKKVKQWKTIDDLYKKIEKFIVDEKEREWRMAVGGNDIMEILNITPGRELGKIKSDMEKKVKAGELPNDRDHLLGYISSLSNH